MTDNPLELERRRDFARHMRERTLEKLGVKIDAAPAETDMARAERLAREYAATPCAPLSIADRGRDEATA